MYFNFNEGSDLVKGYKNCLVLNVIRKNCITINKNFYKILLKCKKGKALEKITNNYNKLIDLLKVLENNNIGKIENVYKKLKKNKINKNVLNMVWLPITNSCNYKCIHCYEEAKPKHEENSIGIKDYYRFFKTLKKKFMVNCVQITGGEPLIKGKKFIIELLDMLSKIDIKYIEIYTNLSFLDDDYIEIFKKYNVHIATSLYSSIPEVNDSITQIKGSQETTIKNLDILKKNNIPFRIGIVIMKQNMNDASSLRKYLNERYNLKDTKNYDIIRPMGRGEIKENIPYELFKDRYINQMKNIPNYSYNFYWYNKVFNSCWGNKVCLKYDGNIYPCVMSKISFGNYKNVNKILNVKNSYRFINKDKVKICKKCEFRYLCTECRAMYSSKKKNLKEKPFTCTYNPKIGIFE